MSIKKPVTDPLFLTTEGQSNGGAAYIGQVAAEIADALFSPPPEGRVKLSTHRKAIDSWKAETEKWKKAYYTELDVGGAWRELAADLEFGGRPYPEKGTPERDAFTQKFRKICDRKKAARASGKPEEGPLK